MPYTPNTIVGKDGGGADRQFTAQGTGVIGDPYLPLHGDFGIGAIDDAPATTSVGNFSVIALFKRLLSVTLYAVVSLLTDMDAAIGDPSDAAATTDTGSFSLISLVKRLLVKTGGGSVSSVTPPTDYRSIQAAVGGPIKSSDGNLMSIEVINVGTTTRWFQLYDELIGPVGIPSLPTTTPIRVFPVFAGGLLVIGKAEWGESGLAFTTAIGWCMSTTPTGFITPPLTDAIVFARHT